MSDSRKLEPTKEPGIYRKGSTYVVRWKYRGKSLKRSFPTMALAKEHKRSLHGHEAAPTTGKRVSEFGEQWIDTYRGRTARGLSDSTRKSYRDSLDRHVSPLPLGRLRMRDVSSADINQWFADLEAEGVPARSIGKAKAALSCMFADAAQAGKIKANPVTGVRYVPAKGHEAIKREQRELSAEDVESILSNMDPRWRVFFDVLAKTGLRVGELLGLTWANVHLGDDPHLSIVEQVYQGRRARLKTDSSKRRCPLSPALAMKLAEWKGDTRFTEDDSPVFPSRAGTVLSYSNVRARVLLLAVESAGLSNVTFHSFRKFYASALLSLGKNVKQVQDGLGHSSADMTVNVYMNNMGEGVGSVDELDALFG